MRAFSSRQPQLCLAVRTFTVNMGLSVAETVFYSRKERNYHAFEDGIFIVFTLAFCDIPRKHSEKVKENNDKFENHDYSASQKKIENKQNEIEPKKGFI